MKTCTKCLVEKQPEQFGRDKAAKDGLASRCKNCKRSASEEYRRANPEKVRLATAIWAKANVEAAKKYRAEHKAEAAARGKKWQQENPEKVAEKTRRWRERNPGREIGAALIYKANNKQKIAASKKAYREANPESVRREGEKRRTCPKYKIEATIRARLHRAIAKNGARTFDLLGYTSEQLKAHLERQFTKGMTWGNYGEWHIDHILPLASFSYSSASDPDFRAAWSLPNLRPLWADENQSKSSKRLTLL